MNAVTIGKFDGFHKGHQKLLQEMLKTDVDETIVCKIDFPGAGLLTRQEQEDYLKQLGIQRLVRLPFTKEFAGKTPEEFVRQVLVEELDARHVIVGSDFRFGCNRIGNVETLSMLGKHYGFQVHSVDKLQMDGDPVSSTRIRAAYEAGEIETAERLLGHEITFSGVVLHGKKQGRTIGFPTVNLVPGEEKLLPAFGAYGTSVTTPFGEFRAIANIGIRPTFDDGDQVTIEAHLKGFDGDLYDQKIRIRLLTYLRPERHFDSVEDLQQQIQKDLLFFDFT